MKFAKTPTTKTGIFVSVAFALIIIALFLIGDKEKLFSSSHRYYVKIKDINGLKEGAQVFITGINVGSVREVRLPRYPGDSVFLELRVVKDAQDLIRTDSKAEIITEGLVGNKAITINVGSTKLPHMNPGDTLIGTSPRDLMALVDNVSESLGSAKALIDEISIVVKDVRTGKGSLGQMIYSDKLITDLSRTIVGVDRTLGELSGAASEVTGSVTTFADTAKNLASKLRGIAENIESGKGTLSRLINDDSLYRELAGLSGTVRSMLVEFKDASAKVSRAAGNTVEITEGLKHNFLVKDYFEKRGYWDAEDFEKRIDKQLDSLRIIEKSIQAKLKQ
jgi:phospholipid/cholesterol/gamma-HCH transport system substrate-binding protein